MEKTELEYFWNKYGALVERQIRSGDYVPQPFLTKCILKKDGKKKRRLEIPCIVDRMLLYAIYIVLMPYYEQFFHQNSYGFRVNKGCHTALDECIWQLNHNTDYVLVIDIKKYFDHINHNKLMRLIKKDVRDPVLLRLIKQYVSPRVVYGNHAFIKYEGLSQGAAVSPLFANIYLNELDWFMSRRKIRFVRYADDLIIFCRNYKQAAEFKELVKEYLRDNLSLEINEEKTMIVKPKRLEFLGYAFTKDQQGRYQYALNSEIQEEMLKKMKKLMNKGSDMDSDWWDRLGAFNRGWINYYKMVDKGAMEEWLQKAESRQIQMISEKYTNNKTQDISGLYTCNRFSSLNNYYRSKWGGVE